MTIGLFIVGAIAFVVMLGAGGYWLVRTIAGPNDVMDRDRDGDIYE